MWLDRHEREVEYPHVTALNPFIKRLVKALEKKYQDNPLKQFKETVLHPRAKLKNYDEVFRACEGLDLSRSVSSSWRSQFIGFSHWFAWHWRTTKNTVLSYLVNPDTSANQFFFELFKMLHGRAPDARDLLFFSPDTEYLIEIEKTGSSTSADMRLCGVKQVLTKESCQFFQGGLTDWVVASGEAIDAAALIQLFKDENIPIEVIRQFISDLATQHPALFEAFRLYNDKVSAFIEMLRQPLTDAVNQAAMQCLADQRQWLTVKRLDKCSRLPLSSLGCVAKSIRFTLDLGRERILSDTSLTQAGDFLAHFNSEEEYTACFRSDDLLWLLSNSHSLGRILGVLGDPLKTTCLLSALQCEPDFYPIKRASDVFCLFRGLSPDQRVAVYNMMALKLLSFVQSGCDFYDVCYYLLPQQRAEVYEALKLRLPDFIVWGEDFFRVLPVLLPAQCVELCVALEQRLPNLIKGLDDLVGMHAELTCEQYSVVCVALKTCLPNFIKTIDDVIPIFQYLQRERRVEIYEALKPCLLNLIKSLENFCLLMNSVPPEVGEKIAEACLPDLVNEKRHFVALLPHIPPIHYKTVCDVLKSRLPHLMSTMQDFFYLFEHLRLFQCQPACEALKSHAMTLFSVRFIDQSLQRLPDDKKNILRAFLLKWGLEKYVQRVSGYGSAACGFWHDARARSLNREVNVALANRVIHFLDENKSQARVLTQAAVRGMRKKIVSEKKQDPLFNKDYVERGMNSHELRTLFAVCR